MTQIEELVRKALQTLPSRPSDDAGRAEKKRYSELMSAALAPAFSEAMRRRGMREIRPAGPGEVDAGSGAERALAGGLGAKRVDLSWATRESGLMFAMSIKAISFRDGRSANFQKNLAGRCETMLFESVTLHRRFPYAVLAGLLVLDKDAEHDHTTRRHSTFRNACARMRLFTGRGDPSGRDEQYERLYVLLVDANPFEPSVRCFPVDAPEEDVALTAVVDDLVALVVERNPDLYEAGAAGAIRRTR